MVDNHDHLSMDLMIMNIYHQTIHMVYYHSDDYQYRIDMYHKVNKSCKHSDEAKHFKVFINSLQKNKLPQYQQQISVTHVHHQ
jgi:hypothetical protein